MRRNPEKNIRLTLAYEGTRYHGWQRQENDLTIQEVVEDRLATMLQERVTLFASGRTDAGVHALGQVAHFQSRTRLAPDVILRGLNSLLPEDILVLSVEHAPQDFHARYSARTKTYEYRLLNRPFPDLFSRRYEWWVKPSLDMEAMARCVDMIRGKHDFSTFRSSGSENRNPVRDLKSARLESLPGGRLRFYLEADGFLRHMVRNMVGTLVDVGLGKMGVEEFREAFEARDRRLAGIKAPARGLFLVRVTY
ncbi:MAG: tRNA pseudouridine(38-40) synthase TruA [Deltaproteobacteria bacterium]|nr:tRNA pseudouridine(38-40) synthase TruA [Deltaproteobacteria bacterium]MBW1922052.1 tRNA pseudouridine(38-40) synthase TruA [Deltaproteobacteria bacterium]MBW1949807.1 tRNA pseudouridine(38-40) synthase TruA [Deltaproteobacteria bacterium]MBW2007684.1 tRNA pseudouridine(38-40) synthase TruA [Deltaproteobacteria bacterium]MBW2103543.1 tRNA pseudouridine(38-40) synthase TruA [Deltaproteobacteria bacterium]